MNNKNIYLVTNYRDNLFDILKKYVQHNIGFIQLRDKKCNDNEFIMQANKINLLCKENSIKFIINDRTHLLNQIKCDGFHIGQDDGNISNLRKKYPNLIMGVSVHNEKEAQLAINNNVDMLGVGAMFKTKTKKNAQNISLETLKKINNLSKNIVIIGGLNNKNINKIPKTLYRWIAFSSYLLDSSNPKKSLKAINKEIF